MSKLFIVVIKIRKTETNTRKDNFSFLLVSQAMKMLKHMFFILGSSVKKDLEM